MVNWLTPLRDGDPAAFRLMTEGGSVVATRLEPALDSESRRRGLLGRDGLDPQTAMLIAPCPAVHTWFMRFAIDVVFADGEGRVLKVCANVKPFRFAAAFGAFAAIEMAAGGAAANSVAAGDRLVLAPAI